MLESGIIMPQPTGKPKKGEMKMTFEDLTYVVVRTYSAGVHAGYLLSRDNKEVVLRNARRIWYWNGATTLNELSVRGVRYPEKCKVPCAVSEITLTEATEIIPCSDQARLSIEGIPIWSAWGEENA